MKSSASFSRRTALYATSAHERAYGFIPGSVGISAEELLASPPGDGKKLIIYCARGVVSVDLADELCDRGLEAYSLEGGYIAWLRAEMRRRNDEELRERVEQSIRKKFRVSLMSKFIKALKTYQLVNEGDRVAVCISGGKDSMLMAKLFQELKRYSEVNFEVKYLVMDPGYNADNRRIIEDNARALGIPVTIFETDIFESVYNVEKSPCYLCARMRRGYLYRFAQELGCNKVALGHHLDDAVETFYMNLWREGRIGCFSPVTYLSRRDLTLIRPMLLATEQEVISAVHAEGLPIVKSVCPADGVTTREDTKNFVRERCRTDRAFRQKTLHALQESDIDGWRPLHPARTSKKEDTAHADARI